LRRLRRREADGEDGAARGAVADIGLSRMRFDDAGDDGAMEAKKGSQLDEAAPYLVRRKP